MNSSQLGLSSVTRKRLTGRIFPGTRCHGADAAITDADGFGGRSPDTYSGALGVPERVCASFEEEPNLGPTRVERVYGRQRGGRRKNAAQTDVAIE